MRKHCEARGGRYEERQEKSTHAGRRHPIEERETLIGLYLGYDHARAVLARLVEHFGSGASAEGPSAALASGGRALETPAWALSSERVDAAALASLSRGAHTAALSAFMTISEQAESILDELRDRWPELCEERTVTGPPAAFERVVDDSAPLTSSVDPDVF